MLGLLLGAIPLATVTCSGAGHASRAGEMTLPSDAQIRRDEARGTVRFLRAANLSGSLEAEAGFRALQSADRFADVALAFVAAYRSLFGLERPADELAVTSVTRDDLGLTHVRLQQVFAGIPVSGAELVVHLDRANHVYLVQGRYVRTPAGLSTAPRLRAEEALRSAAHAVPGVEPDCRGCRAELVVFVGPGDAVKLAYRVLAAPSLAEGWAVMVDADSGTVLEKVPTVFPR